MGLDEDISVCFERILLVSLSPSFDRLIESRLDRAPSGVTFAMDGEPFSTWSVVEALDSSDSSCSDHSPAITDGNRLIIIRGFAETAEKRSIESSYFFCSKNANALRYLTVRSLKS